jgi:hypothetical protein
VICLVLPQTSGIPKLPFHWLKAITKWFPKAAGDQIKGFPKYSQSSECPKTAKMANPSGFRKTIHSHGY